MGKSIAVLATLDTKGRETEFLCERIRELGHHPVVVDIGVVGHATIAADYPRDEIARRGGVELEDLHHQATRERASPVMIAGASKLLTELVAAQRVHAVVALGGTQGTSSGCAIMRELPYGFPKIMVSTCASGDTRPFVGVKDITMMFSVSDILGLNPFMRRVLAQAAAAACGMAEITHAMPHAANKTVIGMTNLGVLSEGTEIARQFLEDRGYETIVFHAVGSGGKALEQMIADGVIGAVFDYALGEISDELFHGLRASDATRLTVAACHGLPQVICPGGTEHVGILLSEAHHLPPRFAGYQNVFHSPIIAAPRLSPNELEQVAEEIGQRLAGVRGRTTFMIPRRGTSRYAIADGPLHNPDSDAIYFSALRRALPPAVDIVERDLAIEDEAFVREACERLIAWITAPTP